MGRDKHGSTDGIEITPAMIEAAAAVLWRHPMLDIPEGFAEGLAREMLKRALLTSQEILDVAREA